VAFSGDSVQVATKRRSGSVAPTLGAGASPSRGGRGGGRGAGAAPKRGDDEIRLRTVLLDDRFDEEDEDDEGLGDEAWVRWRYSAHSDTWKKP